MYKDAFRPAGALTPPIEYYRNMDRNWELTAPIADRTIDVPCLMISAADDPVLTPAMTAGMEERVPDLERVVIENCGHWTQQERPEETTAAMLELPPPPPTLEVTVADRSDSAHTARSSNGTRDRCVPTPLARGPWDPNALHGGAPSALFAMVCEEHDPGPASFIARMTVELHAARYRSRRSSCRLRTIRPGKKVQWLEAQLHDERDREVARATVLRIRVAEVDTSGSVQADGRAAARSRERRPRPRSRSSKACSATGTRRGPAGARQLGREPGPAIAWFRLPLPRARRRRPVARASASRRAPTSAAASGTRCASRTRRRSMPR